MKLLKMSEITLDDLEAALTSNNIEPGSMTVRDGYYEYNIKFSTLLRTPEDVENIYIRKNNHIFQLKDLHASPSCRRKRPEPPFPTGNGSNTGRNQAGG